MSSLGPIVTGFNFFSRILNGVADYIPQKNGISACLNFLAEELPANGLKTLVVRPLVLTSTVLTYLKRNGEFPGLNQASKDAIPMKALISALEVITKLPGTLKALATEVKGSENTRQYAKITTTQTPTEASQASTSTSTPPKTPTSPKKILQKVKKLIPIRTKDKDTNNNASTSTTTTGTVEVEETIQIDVVDGPQLSPVEVVSGRIFSLANWTMAFADAISYVKTYYPIHKKLDNATPWIYALTGGYMGAQGLYAEWKFAQETWKDETKNAVPAEKYYGLLNLATNSAYLFQSIVGGLGLYYNYKNQKPSWLGNWQFAATVAIVILPVAQRCAKQYMQINYWS